MGVALVDAGPFCHPPGDAERSSALTPESNKNCSLVEIEFSRRQKKYSHRVVQYEGQSPSELPYYAWRRYY